MEQTGQQLFAFVDHKDPFMPAAIAEEELPGPILSILAARAFDRVHLFHRPQLAPAADSTEAAIRIRWRQCRVEHYELPISDPKDYSSVMGALARQVRQIARATAGAENFVCVSSGTAEMRGAWFLLAASGVLPATLLQVGSPAEPLFGTGNVKEVRLDRTDWSSLRDLVMPQEYFLPSDSDDQPEYSRALTAASAPADEVRATSQAYPGLEDALQKLGIFVGSAVLRVAAERAAIAAESELPILLLGERGLALGCSQFSASVPRVDQIVGCSISTLFRMFPVFPVAVNLEVTVRGGGGGSHFGGASGSHTANARWR